MRGAAVGTGDGAARVAGEEWVPRIAPAASAAMRAAVRLAGGRELCFVATVTDDGIVHSARVVARGDARSVLALPGVAQRGEMLLHNHPSGDLEPSAADLEIAARLHDDGIGFGIVDNEARALYVVVEVPRERAMVRIDPGEIDATLGQGGAIAAGLPAYEDRASQRAMAVAIARLYNLGGIGVFEAGTGVGKSLGYLLPALRWAAANGEPTIVSTNTINLQEQLVGKDLPLLARTLTDQPVRFALLKGWRNYLCLLRLEQASAGATGLFEPAIAGELAELTKWAELTTDGSLGDLPVPPRPELWDEVAAEPDLCARLECAHFDRCFLFQARRRAAQADVVVVNHHLLLSDLAVRRAQQNWGDAAVLPAYRRLVVDEGHHLEDAAAAHLGSTATRRGLQRALGRLDRRGKGLLPALAQRLNSQRDLLSVASLDLVHNRLAPSVHAAREKGSLVFDLLERVLAQSGETVFRITADFAAHPMMTAGLDSALMDLVREIQLLHDGLRLVRERLEGDSARREETAPLLSEMRAVARRLEGMGDALVCALRPAPDAAASVRWIELRGTDHNVAATSVPLDVAPILREDLFKRLETGVITSATLAANGDFGFLRTRLGLDDPLLDPTEGIFPSPFRFEQQAILALPTDLPAPNVDAPGHLRMVIRVALELANLSDGGLFLLFTSHRDVRAAAVELRARASERLWPLLVHGEDSRDGLLRRFRESRRAILVGTSSFWEGVDVAGQALRALVLARIPFRVPSDPLTAAHCEAILENGGDAFTEFMLPHAALRLKQGFGRLIRSGTDHGVVVICDPRASTKPYGRELIAALPPARQLVGSWEQMLPELKRFYGAHPS